MRNRNDWQATGHGLLGVTLTCLTFSGCDIVNIEKLEDLVKAGSPPSDAYSEANEARAETAQDAEVPAETESTPSATPASNPRTMDSIEPDDSMRLYYQFIDAIGAVRFVERLDEVPGAWREKVGFVEMDRPPPFTPAEARKTWAPDLNKVLAAEVRVAAVSRTWKPAKPKVVLYSADWCGYCDRASTRCTCVRTAC